MKEWDKAKVDFEKSIQLDSKAPLPYGNMSNYYWARETNKTKALGYLELELKNGFKQWPNLFSNVDDGYFLKGLNESPEFKDLLSKYVKLTTQ